MSGAPETTSDSTPETDERIMSLCEDPVYYESMEESCTCILGAGEIRKGIDALTKAHKEDVQINARITSKNRDKRTALDAEMSRYRTQLNKTAYWTKCRVSNDESKAECARQDYGTSKIITGDINSIPGGISGKHITKEVKNTASCGIRTSGLGVLDDITDTLSAQNHAWCTYTEDQKVAKVKAQRANLKNTLKYKHEDYRVPDIDVGGIANLCCMNVIKLDAKDGGKIDAKDIQQTCTQEVNRKIETEMGEKGLGTPEYPIPPKKRKSHVITYIIILLVISLICYVTYKLYKILFGDSKEE